MKKKNGISLRAYAAAASAAYPHPPLDDSAVEIQIKESERVTLRTTLEARPTNTKRKYDGYQKEFVEWCNVKQFCDGATVTKGKLHLFLTDQVVGRESKKKKGTTVGGSTVCGYANAVVDLYNQQVALHVNSNQHPRSGQVKQLIKNVQAQTTETKKKSYQDRGVGSLLDGYHFELQFRQICDSFFQLNDLRGRAAFLVSHYGLLRGENIRDLELADMFSQPLENEGFQTCTALVLDAIVLFEYLPAKIRQHQIFGERFQQYRTHWFDAVQAAQHPVEAQLQVAMPILSEKISTQHAAVMDKVESRHKELVKLVQQTQGQLTSFLHGDIAFRLLPVQNTNSEGVNQTKVRDHTNNTNTPGITQQQASPTIGSTPQYSMSRGVSTISQLWTEWHEGLANQPSIETLERTNGTKWRSSARESKFFSRRLYIILYFDRAT